MFRSSVYRIAILVASIAVASTAYFAAGPDAYTVGALATATCIGLGTFLFFDACVSGLKSLEALRAGFDKLTAFLLMYEGRMRHFLRTMRMNGGTVTGRQWQAPGHSWRCFGST